MLSRWPTTNLLSEELILPRLLLLRYIVEVYKRYLKVKVLLSRTGLSEIPLTLH